jgi:hypothetical protein
MPKIRYLCVRFSNNLFSYDVPKFRAAVIEKTERVSSHFHNHKDDTQVIYRYPLIQYKVTNRKASIICLEDGADEIHHLLQYKDLNLRIGNDTADFEIENIDLHYHQVQLWNTFFDYSLLNWLALNQDHHRRFIELKDNETEQVSLLKSILTGNILSFAKGINWRIEDKVLVEITDIKEMKAITFKNRDLLSLSLNFRTNVSLPDFIGLGKGSSVGFGMVRGIGSQKIENQ